MRKPRIRAPAGPEAAPVRPTHRSRLPTIPAPPVPAAPEVRAAVAAPVRAAAASTGSGGSARHRFRRQRRHRFRRQRRHRFGRQRRHRFGRQRRHRSGRQRIEPRPEPISQRVPIRIPPAAPIWRRRRRSRPSRPEAVVRTTGRKTRYRRPAVSVRRPNSLVAPPPGGEGQPGRDDARSPLCRSQPPCCCSEPAQRRFAARRKRGARR